MNREELERSIHAFYASRLSNDAETVLAEFAPDGEFVMEGSQRFSPVVAANAKAQGAQEFADMIRQVVGLWDWRKQEFVSILIENDRAAVCYDLTTVFTPTGEEITTRLVDLWTVEDGKIKSLHEFVDTALVAALAAKVEG